MSSQNQGTLYKINNNLDNIIGNSKLIFTKNNEELKIINNLGEEPEIITINDIFELKNLTQIAIGNKDVINSLIKNEKSNVYKKIYSKIIFFLDLTYNIEEIYDLITILRIKGNTLPFVINVIISYPDIKYFFDNDINQTEFNFVYSFLLNAKMNIINKLNSFYKKMINIRFIYGNQINNILDHIKGKIQLNSLLRYILNYADCNKSINDLKKEFKRTTNNYINKIDLYNNDSFNIINEYINNLFLNNNSSIENHYNNISIKEGLSLKGIYTYLSDSNSFEEDFIKIFLNNTGKIPVAQNILINSEETTYEEMQSFLNRAILCEYNTLFICGIRDSLSDSQQKYFINLINELLSYKFSIFKEKNKDEKIEISDTYSYLDSCIIFVYNKKNELLFHELYKFRPNRLSKIMYSISLNNRISEKEFMNLKDSNILKESFYENTKIIKSKKCGLGKSTKIKNLIGKNKKIYIYFPLGGNFTNNFIYNKLDNIIKDINTKTKSNFKDIAIHLDLFEAKYYSILNEFLFSFLITKFYSNNGYIIYIPSNIEIYIEIPNCFDDFISHFGILKFFNMTTIEELLELDLPLDTKNLFKNILGIDNNYQLYKWIIYQISLPQFSYHQINIFIKLFLKKFNIFQGKKLRFIENEFDITDSVIRTCTKSLIYFIHNIYSKILLDDYNQKNNIIDEISQLYFYDEDKFNFKYKLIFINENKGTFYNLDLSLEALKNGETLGKLTLTERKNREKKKSELPLNYFEKLEYLDIFKKIFGLKNPIKYDEDNNLISLLEIIERDGYILTIDNFRKMILIMERIMANIPVILMGETGYGKTSLIKKLNQLLNNGEENLIYINLGQMYTYETIIEMLNKINEEEKLKKDKKEKWIFFDDLNTCNFLELITEIFINRTFEGKVLEENIRVIGACNPYRKRKENIFLNDLKYNDDKELAYFSNILPQSLMFYVFNFGFIKKEEKLQYISNIISDIIPEQKLKEATVSIISKCHDFLRLNFDPSNVSLRNINWFKKLYCFFIEYYKNKAKLFKKKSGTDESNKLKSIIISIYLCYYVRLSDTKIRSNFDLELEYSFIKLVNYKNNNINLEKGNLIYDGDLKNELINNYNIIDFHLFKFSYILSLEEDFIIDNISLDKGIGKNKCLKENIFLLFVSLITNIPLLIIGNPGFSKSLSAQIIFKEMRGKYSRNQFFSLYPPINSNYYHCSNLTTPNDIDIFFQIVENNLKYFTNNKNENLPISVIVFDELESINQFNLQIINKYLDFNRNNITWVGISSSYLNISKIKRALILSVPDLSKNLDDLKITSIRIAESINMNFGKNKIFNKILPNVYYYFKEILNLLKILSIYKKLLLEEYKILINKYEDNEEFKKIFYDIDEYKNYFEEKKINPRIYEYDTLKKVKYNLKKFLLSQSEGKNAFLDENIFLCKNIFNNIKFKKLFESDKNNIEDISSNTDFYYLIKAIAYKMNKIKEINNEKIIRIIKTQI